MKFCFLAIAVAAVICQGQSSEAAPEKAYQSHWCTQAQGITEYRLPDRTRVDCVAQGYAIEFDFARKWAEAVGQSLHYALQTGEQPGIVLILEKPSDARYLERLSPLAEKYGIRLWTITPQDISIENQ